MWLPSGLWFLPAGGNFGPLSFSLSSPLTLPNIPANPPERFARGTTVAFTVDAGDYPAADGWTLKWALAGVSQTTVVGTSGPGNGYTVTFARADNTLAHGTYRWVLWVERSSPASEKVDLARGVVLVDDDLTLAADGDRQLTDEQELELVDEAIRRRLAGDISEYTIQSGGGDGRSGKREDLPTLYRIRASLRARIARKRRGGRMRQIRMGFTPVN